METSMLLIEGISILNGRKKRRKGGGEEDSFARPRLKVKVAASGRDRCTVFLYVL